MTFATLALIVLIGIAGPMLAWRGQWHVPVVLGELLAGIAFGATGFDRLHAHEPTFTFLADIGFALVMFVVGSHLPLRDARLGTALRIGVARAVAVGAVSVPLAFALSHLFGTGHTALFAVLIASSSAALILPTLESVGVTGATLVDLLPQVALADTACIIALPLAIDPSHAGRAALGSLAVIAAAFTAYVVIAAADRHGLRRKMHDVSEDRKFALELRISLVVLFALAALATRTHISIMLAGFSFGLAIAAIGEPRRLARQLFAVTDGFFGPLFFVWLGASLDLRDLWHHPSYIGLGVGLGAAAVAAHGLMRVSGQPLSSALVASAQLGVPVAAAALGTQLQLLEPGEPAALILGALVTVTVMTLAAADLARHDPGRTAGGHA
jgi:Kef-type K+ transport system membrane component KefB